LKLASNHPKRLCWLLGAGTALILALTVLCREFKLAVVVGDSMLPTLKPGDLMIVDRRAYEQSQPERGDIVVARYGKDWVVKRVVGLPGEEVEVKKGELFIDGAPRAENHPRTPGTLDVAKGRLLDGDFATLGDNRAVPAILAVHPIVSRREILGKVIFARSWLPLLRNGTSPKAAAPLRHAAFTTLHRSWW
jgi:signal peptidase I